MYYFTLNQAYVFAFSVYGGLIMGLLYDVFRLPRRIFHAGRTSTAILDCLFWLSACAVGIIILFLSSDGKLRVFPFIGYILGFFIYLSGISSLFWWIVKKIKNKFKKPFQNGKKTNRIE
ncbi:spore cortex biosynthesis protein YabQ [Clostridia bacterium OttesenSCG-928-F22]|nr:spore cortex biosynthesis protein YabQ [Clostridia bacterium OttesenSCG-928-F22]